MKRLLPILFTVLLSSTSNAQLMGTPENSPHGWTREKSHTQQIYHQNSHPGKRELFTDFGSWWDIDTDEEKRRFNYKVQMEKNTLHGTLRLISGNFLYPGPGYKDWKLLFTANKPEINRDQASPSQSSPSVPTPEPSTLLLFGVGLIIIAKISKRRLRSRSEEFSMC